MIDDELFKLEYDQNLLAEGTNMKDKELLPLQRPMHCGVGYPESWLFNVKEAHDEKSDQCHCLQCYLKDHPYLFVGEPQRSGRCTVEYMKSMGIVGLYKSPPVATHKCSICGKEANWSDPIKDGTEVVHVDCLPEEHRQDLLDVGYCLESILRKKGEGYDTNREVVVGSTDHECTEEGGSEDGGESVQGNGKKKGAMVQAGGNGTSEQSRQSGVDVHTEQASKGTREESREVGSREKASNAEKDSDSAPVFYATELREGAGD